MTDQIDSYSSNKPYLFRAIFEWLLDNNATPYILVDATQDLVEVPEEHIKNGQIVLNINPSAVRDWLADNDAISFNARFSGSPRQIYVPMNALMAVYSQENGLGMAFPVLDEQDEAPETEVNDQEKPQNKTDKADKTAEISAVKQEPGVTSKASSKPKGSTKNKKPSHLKVIK